MGTFLVSIRMWS